MFACIHIFKCMQNITDFLIVTDKCFFFYFLQKHPHLKSIFQFVKLNFFSFSLCISGKAPRTQDVMQSSCEITFPDEKQKKICFLINNLIIL